MKYVYANLVIVVVYVDDWLMTRSDEWHHHRRARVLWFLKIGESLCGGRTEAHEGREKTNAGCTDEEEARKKKFF